MCGIIGWKSYNKIDEHIIKKMAKVIAHRGPDGEGYYFDEKMSLAFAHKRLAIIDPEHGQQPMSTQDGSLYITFNGAIYNFLELRRELVAKGHPIKTYSDTEVILYAYKEWGEKCVGKLNGMFAFVIHDKKNKILFGARDRLGEKPFYYYRDRNNFVFASEIKAILASGILSPALNNKGLHDYLTFQFYLDDKTLFSDIKKLKPGHYFILNEKTLDLNIKEYWDINYDEIIEDKSEEYFVDRLRALIEDSIMLRLRADVPLGSHLSGGIDSSAVAALNSMRLGDLKLETFTGKFAEGDAYDETKYAKEVAKSIDSIYNEILITDQQFLDSIEDIIWYMDEPEAGPGVFSQYQVANYAAQKVKVVLGGQGGDETFIGYTRYLIAYFEKMLKRNIQEGGEYYQNIFRDMTPSLYQMHGYEPMMRDFFAQGMFEDDSKRYFRMTNRFSANQSIFTADFLAEDYKPYEEFEKIFSKYPKASIINKMSYFDLKTFLPSLLHVEDRTSMAHGLESRVPFLDHRIIEFTAKIPPHIKFKNGVAKHLPKKVFRNIIPDSVLDRKDKKGFPTPTNLWFKTSLNSWVKDLLSDQRTLDRGLYDKKELLKMVDGTSEYNRALWGIINLELWHRRFIDA